MSKFNVNNDLKQNYDQYYDSDSISAWRELCAVDKANNIMALCKSIPHDKILDIGSGEGSVLRKLSEFGFGNEIYSIDISTSAVNIINSSKIPNLIECKLYDGYNIPYPDEMFDIVIMTHVLEHIEYPRAILKEAGRVAKYKHLFIEVPLELTLRLPTDYKYNDVGHINHYSPKSIRYLLQTTGFKILIQKITNPSYSIYKYSSGIKALFRYLPKHILLKLCPCVAVNLFTYHCMILGTKHN